MLSSPSVNEHRERDIIAHCEGEGGGRSGASGRFKLCLCVSFSFTNSFVEVGKMHLSHTSTGLQLMSHSDREGWRIQPSIMVGALRTSSCSESLARL